MKNNSMFIADSFWSKMGWMMLFFLLPFVAVAQSYEQLWKDVESSLRDDLPRSAIEQLVRISEKAKAERNMPQLMKAELSRAMEQVKLTPDSADMEVKRLQRWAETEQDKVTAALLHHVVGNIAMQREEADWKGALHAYQSALKEKNLLLHTSAADYVPMTISTDFSKRFFQNNLYDLLVHQTIAGLVANWQWRKNVEVQEWIIDLYDSLIDAYGIHELNYPTAALLSHEAKIVFLQEEGVVNTFRLSKEKAEKGLRDLLRLYEPEAMKTDGVENVGGGHGVDSDALVDVRLKLAEILCDQQRLQEAMNVLKVAQQRYPKSQLIDEVKGKMDWIYSPSLSVEVPVAYPSYKGKLVVNYRNVSEFELETYRLNLHPDAPELNGNQKMEVLCDSYGKKVSTQRFHLPATTDYKARIEQLDYVLPEEGIYALKIAAVDRKGKANYQLMYVSRFQCVLIPLLDGHTEVVVVDRMSGNPVLGAEVVEYKRDGYAARFLNPTVWKTDAKGSVILKNPERGPLFINARKPGHNFMKISSAYPGRTRVFSDEGKRMPLTALYTDRALYRPGQVVHVSGIRYEQLGDSLRTLQNQVMKVELLDVNGKRVGEASATSDAFGVFAVDFTLPKQVLPGYFTLRTDNKTIGIRVENYKRPTFDVVFSPITKSYTFDDVVRAEGSAQTFAGAPVRLAKGTYTVIRSEAWLWRRGGAETALATGEFTTDAEGKFQLDVTLEAPVNESDSYVVPYYNYVIRANVTDGAGETHETTLTLPVGKRSMGIQILGLKSKLACERKEKIQFQAMNLSKQLVKTEVNYQVYSLKESDEKVGKMVLEGKAMSQESFVPMAIYALPAGKYQLKVSARDDQNRTVTTTQDFILFSLMNKRPPIHTVQWFYQDGENWENGKPVTFYVGSSENNVYLMMDVFSAQKRIRTERILMKNCIRKFEFAYDESYGDGIVVSFAFLRDGKFYTKQVRLEKPKPEKELTLKWESFRDQLTPGQKEVWRMKITDSSGHPVRANLLGALYDASLDKLQAHSWRLQPSFTRWLPYVGIRSFSHADRTMFYVDFPYVQNMNGYRLLGQNTYSSLLSFPLWSRPIYLSATTRTYASPAFAMVKSAAMPNSAIAEGDGATIVEDEFAADLEEEAVVEVQIQEETKKDKQASEDQQTGTLQTLRQNFEETAFYYPTLRTDANGEVSISFTLPDALTEWKFMGLAHTQGFEYGQLTSKVMASKPFMVQPNLPRFVRIGDASSLAVSLVNLSMETVAGKVRMELVNPINDQIVFKHIQDFHVEEGKTSVVSFNYKIIDDYDVLVCRVVADAGEFSDGEQHYLPVLTQKEWVTETIPFQVKGDESVDVSLQNIFNKRSKTATGQQLTVELTANPNWYVIQALSAIANPTNEDAISWAAAYYANALALQMVRSHPRIQEVFELWQKEEATKETLWSKLEQHADLKQCLLDETPWLAEAQTETEQKRRIALLFELNGMEQRLQLAVQQLKKLQTSDGGWTWYPGMPVNRYTTTQVVELMARLKAKGVKLDAVMDEAYRRGVNYLKQEARKEKERILKSETDNGGEKRLNVGILMPSDQVIHYLYSCALDGTTQSAVDRDVNTFFIERLSRGGISIQQKALTAIVLHANGKKSEAEALMRSVKEYLVSTPEMGCYFDTFKATYSWNSFRIPTQVAAMEAIYRISPETELLDGMRLWLLKQKQVQAWNTPVATVDAVYAFLLGDDALRVDGMMKAQLVSRKDVNKRRSSGKGTILGLGAQANDKVLVTPGDGLGYTRTTFKGNELGLVNDNLQLHVEKVGKGIGWGAVYAQYFEEMNKITKSEDKGISLTRDYLVDGRPVTAKSKLHIGDKITVRFTIKVDRDMDFVRIRDQRAACMEPSDQLSGIVWSHGVSAYRVNRDASTEFFIDKLPKGTHIIEYQVYVNRTGSYQSGTSTVQSVYAPEFAAHTAGMMLEVNN